MTDAEENRASPTTPRARRSLAPGRDQVPHGRTPPQTSSAADGYALPHVRVSPYPQRVRTPPTRYSKLASQASPSIVATRASPPWSKTASTAATRASQASPPIPSTVTTRTAQASSLTPSIAAAPATQASPAPSSTASARLHQDASAPPTSADPSTAAAAPSAAHQHRLQLLVRPIVKSTVGQRDTSGEALDNFAVNGATFDDINHKLWRQFGSRVKGQAVKQDGVWTISTPTETSWSKVMQFKGSRHLVDSEKTEQAWSRWVVSTKGEAVRLMIYEYGMAITKAQDLEGFREACIRPAFTDRSGASAESSVRDVVAQLQDIWSETFQARAVVWRMWANHVMRGLDRSTWDRDILEPPPSQIANLLKPADLPAERQLAGLSRSSDLALQVVNAAIEDNKRLKASWKAHGERLENLEQLLLTRKRTIEAILAGTRLPSLSDVIDPLPALTNIEDIEHQE